MPMYRYTHTHEGMGYAPEFDATDDDDARAYVRTRKGILPGQPLTRCFCNSEKLERLSERKRNGNVVAFQPTWIEIKLE